MDRLYAIADEGEVATMWVHGELPVPPDWIEIRGADYVWAQLTRPRFSWFGLAGIILIGGIVSALLR